MNSAQLPNRFPIGTHYVIEGKRKSGGGLRIVSRRLILPDGQAIELTGRRAGAGASIRRSRTPMQSKPC